MKPYLVQTRQLTKRYGKHHALQDVSLQMEAGKIYGLIGQNGAGKTTLMRLLAGLIFPSGGEIELFGSRGERALQRERRKLGCMIEHPGFIPHLSAADNLRYYRITRGIPNQELETELLELVGLSGTGKKPAKSFSLGMKQRLGIAVALLGNPELLMLDEPVNGLDPAGVVEIRKLLKRLCEERQMTLLISSHNLPELYLTATDYLIVHQGRLKQTLSHPELEAQCQRHLRIECDQPEKLASVLDSELKSAHFTVMPDKSVKLYDHVQEKEKVARILYDNGLVVFRFAVEGDTLENYFLSAIGGEAGA